MKYLIAALIAQGLVFLPNATQQEHVEVVRQADVDAGVHFHCYHTSNFVYATNPPIFTRQCCICGKVEEYSYPEPDRCSGHGRYSPDCIRPIGITLLDGGAP